jgi:hypothetical protein
MTSVRASGYRMRITSLPLVVFLVSSVALSASASDRGGRIAEETTLAQASKEKPPTDAQIRQILIDESIAAYEGNCPCPYSRARNGSRCGKRSAYSKPGGAEPLCYAKDVTDDMVREYREGHSRS